jgi:hypothetical protein
MEYLLKKFMGGAMVDEKELTGSALGGMTGPVGFAPSVQNSSQSGGKVENSTPSMNPPSVANNSVASLSQGEKDKLKNKASQVLRAGNSSEAD